MKMSDPDLMSVKIGKAGHDARKDRNPSTIPKKIRNPNTMPIKIGKSGYDAREPEKKRRD